MATRFDYPTFDSFTFEERSKLWEYPFIKDYILMQGRHGKKRDHKFFRSELETFKEDLRKIFPESVFEERFNELSQLKLAMEMEVKEAAFVEERYDRLKEAVYNEFPEIFVRYELILLSLRIGSTQGFGSVEDYEAAAKEKRRLYFEMYQKEEDLPLYTIILYNRDNKSLSMIEEFGILEIKYAQKLKKNNDEDSRKTLESTFCGKVERIFEAIDAHDPDFGMTHSNEVNKILVEHVRAVFLHEEMFVPRYGGVWPEFPRKLGRIGARNTKGVYAHAEAFKIMVNVYRQWLGTPKFVHLRPLILELYTALKPLMDIPEPLTPMQRIERKIVKTGLLDPLEIILSHDSGSGGDPYQRKLGYRDGA